MPEVAGAVRYAMGRLVLQQVGGSSTAAMLQKHSRYKKLMFEVLHSWKRLITAFVRPRVDLGLFVPACLVLAGCVSAGGDERRTDSDPFATGAVGASLMDRQPTRRMDQSGAESTRGAVPGIRGAIPDTAGPFIARDMATSLAGLLQRSLGALPRLAVTAPTNTFDLELIDGLQRAGFEVFLDKGESASNLLSYRLDPHLNGVVDSKAKVSDFPSQDTLAKNPDTYNLNDYRFILVFDRWIMSRDYRINNTQVRPLAPVNIMVDQSVQRNRVASELLQTK